LTSLAEGRVRVMKKLRIFGVVPFAMLVLSVIGVSSASALDLEVCAPVAIAKTGKWTTNKGVDPDLCEGATTTGEWELYEVEFLLALWLEGSTPVTTILPVEAEGELELVSLNAANLKITTKLLCSGIFDGWIGPESLGAASELLTLGGVAEPLTPLTGTALLCTNDGNCTEPEVWAAGLPWEGEVELAEVLGVGSFFVGIGFKGGWYAQCLILGVTASETCEAPESVGELTNETNGTVDGTTSDAFTQLMGYKLGNCTSGGAESAELNGLGILLESGVSISVSSE
jgi:hypothetical protein